MYLGASACRGNETRARDHTRRKAACLPPRGSCSTSGGSAAPIPSVVHHWLSRQALTSPFSVVCSVLSSSDTVMFKSILPSRRVPSSPDFQMLTTPVDPSETEPNGKENYFENPNVIHDNNAKPKTEKRKKMKGKMQPEQEIIPTEEFDRLLVRLHPRFPLLCNFVGFP